MIREKGKWEDIDDDAKNNPYWFSGVAAATGRTEDPEINEAEKLRPGSGEVFVNIGKVVVQDRKDATRNIDLPGSVDVLGWDEVKYENLDNALELLR